MNKLSITILFFVLLNSCNSQTKNQIKDSLEGLSEERIEFISRNDTLVGYLKKPNKLLKFPVIVVLHSANHGHHDNAIYNHLEMSMNDVGVGVFTFDRRGTGESNGNFNTSSLEDLANDALRAIEILKKRKDIDSQKIGLYGVSQGGWISPLVYSLNKDDVSFMILVSSCGVSPAKQMEYSAVTTLKMNGNSEDVISKAKYLRNIVNEYYRGKRERESTQNEIDKYRDKEWFSDAYLPWRGNLPEDVSVTKWIHEMDFEPKQYFESIDIPIILFYGEFDRWVPIQESIEIWTTALKNSNNDYFKIHQIKDAGHMMIIDEDSHPEQEIISNEYTALLKKEVEKIIK